MLAWILVMLHMILLWNACIILYEINTKTGNLDPQILERFAKDSSILSGPLVT